MECLECQNRGTEYGGLFNIACPDCRRAIALSEPCKIVRKQMVDGMLDKWGDTQGWQDEPHCGCEKVCKRRARIKQNYA